VKAKEFYVNLNMEADRTLLHSQFNIEIDNVC